MSLAANALTSIANAQLWLRRNHAAGSQATDDTALLTLLINGVSTAIERHTERQFFAEDGATKTFKYQGGNYLDLVPYELRVITSLTLGGATLAAADGAGAGDYYAEPRNKSRDGTYLSITLRDYVHPYPPNSMFAAVLNERDVVIVGNWGMAAVPANVELACLIAVADMYRNPEQVSSRGAGDFTMAEVAANPGSEESLPPGALRLLEPFVRPKVA